MPSFWKIYLFLVLTFLSLGGCTGEQQASFAKNKIEEYKQNPTKENKEEAQAALSELDAAIHKLEAQISKEEGETKKEDQRRLNDLKKKRAELSSDFTKAKADALLKDLEDFFQTPPFFNKTKDNKNQ